MVKRERLIELLCGRRPPQAKYNDVKKLLEMEGYAHVRTNGSHFSFAKANHSLITVSVHDKKVTTTYIDLMCTQLGLDEEQEA